MALTAGYLTRWTELRCDSFETGMGEICANVNYTTIIFTPITLFYISSLGIKPDTFRLGDVEHAHPDTTPRGEASVLTEGARLPGSSERVDYHRFRWIHASPPPNIWGAATEWRTLGITHCLFSEVNNSFLQGEGGLSNGWQLIDWRPTMCYASRWKERRSRKNANPKCWGICKNLAHG
jgi:hypothetical protein